MFEKKLLNVLLLNFEHNDAFKLHMDIIRHVDNGGILSQKEEDMWQIMEDRLINKKEEASNEP